MTKIDPFIAVKDVNTSARWYEQIFGFQRTHGGDELAVMAAGKDEIILCLHKWGEHQHPCMTTPDPGAGNGLLLYIKVKNITNIRQKFDEMDWPLEKDIHVNPNSSKQEFLLKDPDGYYLTVTEYHEYEG